jgi:hypothetical protein
MNITREELKELTVQVAKQRFGTIIFKRRQLMHEVEKRVKELGHWTPEDDEESGSSGQKSKGLANIDWAVSHLKQEGRLLNQNRDQWRVP